MTICNTGALATGGHGTALGMVRSALELGTDIHLYACETRPYNQVIGVLLIYLYKNRHLFLAAMRLELHAAH